MASDNAEQKRLDGATVENDVQEAELDDFGERLSRFKSKGGYRRSVLKSLLQKAVRRSDIKVCSWAAWELARSGDAWGSFGRLILMTVEDIAAGEPVVLQLEHLERVALATGVESEIGQIAAIKAARLCAGAWSSRESVHLDDYLRHVAKLQARLDDPPYTFPVEPGEHGYEFGDRPDPEGSQLRFGDSGLERDVEIPTTDSGEPLREFETKGGFHNEEVLDLLDQSLGDEDWELAGFAAWELTRSGYHSAFWDRINELAIRYSAYDSDVPALVRRYESLATERWSPTEWEGRISAIHAVFTILRHGEVADEVEQVTELQKLADLRARGEARFPVEHDELKRGGKYDVVLDKHVNGSGDRGWKHFWSKASRVSRPGEPERSCEWQRRRMDMTRSHFRRKFDDITDEAIEHALSPVSADEPWEEDRVAPDQELDSFE